MHTSNASLQGTRLPSPRRLKNEAKQLPAQLSHIAKLNLVAKAHGWSSYKIYERAWSAQKEEYVVTLSARWFDRDMNTYGRLHTQVRLTEPWANFLPLPMRRRIHVLGSFRIARGDRSHLIAAEESESWCSCVHNLGKASRQLVFIDAMRVLPASYAKAVKGFRGDPHRMLISRFPNGDHESVWFDPVTGLNFILNEPYQVNHEKQDPYLASRAMMAFTTPEWTIHNPGGTLAQLIAPVQDQDLLEALFNRSKVLPFRFGQISFRDDDGQLLDIFR